MRFRQQQRAQKSQIKRETTEFKRYHTVVRATPQRPESSTLEVSIADDRDIVQAGDKVLLIIEDDIDFAGILLNSAREHSFKAIVAVNGEQGIKLAKEFKPSAITLDINLPIMDGWSVLDRLKHDSQIRHIPVYIVSIVDEEQRGLQLGAISFMNKPITHEGLDSALDRISAFIDRPIKELLIVEEDEDQRQKILDMVNYQDIATVAVGSGAAALEQIAARSFDCMILNLDLPDMTGFQLIDMIESRISKWDKPIIVNTSKSLTPHEELQLKKLAKTIIIKDVRSMERLLDETALLLHRIEENLPEEQRLILEELHKTNPVLEGKKVLIVDDDIRNIFAIASVLERYNMDVIYAENGRDGIEKLNNTDDVDLVLMDVMMPEMDGYETMRAIRDNYEFRSLPIIALTAKAMQGDREKCLEAGASDYVPKPVDVEQLLSVLRVWLYS